MRWNDRTNYRIQISVRESEYQHLLSTIKHRYPYSSLVSTKEYLEQERDLQVIKKLHYLTEFIVCPSCNEEVPSIYNYCPFCGKELKQ